MLGILVFSDSICYTVFTSWEAPWMNRHWEVCYEKVRKTGFEITIDIDSGIDELLRAIQVIEIKSPYSNV